MKIQANGFPTLVTALYPRDDKFLQSDAVLGVKSALVCVSSLAGKRSSEKRRSFTKRWQLLFFFYVHIYQDLKTITEAGKAKEAGFTDSNDFVLLEWDFILSP